MSNNSPVLRWIGTSLLFGGITSAFASCTTPATEIVAGVTTQMQVPKDLQAVGIVVRLGGKQIFCERYPVGPDGTVTLPSTLGVVPQEDREGAIDPVTVAVIGFAKDPGETFADTCIVPEPDDEHPEISVIRRRRMPYLTDRIVFMPLPLKESCTGVPCEDENTTCMGGVCEDDSLPEALAVDYQDSLIFGNSNTCFSPEFCLSLTNATTQEALLTNPEDCTFVFPVAPDAEPPPTQPGSLNVEVLYSSFGSEILDLDDKEGFILPEPSDPLTFRLAPNLCEENYKKGKIIRVLASPLCPAKSALQPICDSELADIQNGSRSPQGGSDIDLCAVSPALRPAESALYVLLDHSVSMEEFFGPNGLAFALDLPFKNPVSQRTRLAFAFLPAEAGDCTANPNPFVTPLFDFGDVEDLREPIAQALGAADALLPDDPPLFLDAAMTGAYTALAGLTTTEPLGTFNRRALIVVGNRDFQSHCAPSIGLAADLAAAAKASDNIYTYVARLDAPATADQLGGDPSVDAAAIATAGGTPVFTELTDVQTVLNDLGSCYYDPPPSTKVENVSTFLSYVNPVTHQRVDIERNDGCNTEDTIDAVDGWGMDNGAVRICGAPCAELRDALTQAAAVYGLSLGQPPPAIQIVPSVPCSEPDRFTPGLPE